MIDPLKNAVLAAVRRIARPLARLLLDAGVGVGEFNAIMKIAFVRAAQDASDSPRTSASRIASLTGLTRREVAALLQAPEDKAPDIEHGRPRIQRVITGWWTDPDFQDAVGSPALLPLRGPKKSFANLVARYSGDPRVQTTIDELLRARAVRETKDGRFEVLTRTFSPSKLDAEGMTRVGEQIRDHLETLVYNLRHPSMPRFHRVIENSQLDPRYVPVLVRDISSQADSLADSVDDALNNPAATVKPGNQVQDAARLGVAIYIFEEPVVVAPPPGSKRSSPKRKGR
ncbi:MAG: hypothetical protein JSS86_00060 [Cyanobacteria bacterium SZAS LIN-2]|nr:hypothetical protein [Cyanobacteria bacterium SZAS LIN-2]